MPPRGVADSCGWGVGVGGESVPQYTIIYYTSIYVIICYTIL